MAHVRAVIDFCLLAVRVSGASVADTDIFFFRAGNDGMALHHHIAFTVKNGEVRCARCAWDKDKQVGAVRQNAEMCRIADDDASGFSL